MWEALSQWEAGALLWIQQFLRNPVTDPFFTILTHLGDHGALFIALTLLLLLSAKNRKLGVAAAIALIFSLLFTNLTLKLIFQRERPFYTFWEFLTPLVYEGDPNSFPSGHASAAFAFGTAIFLSAPRGWMKIGAPVLAVLMAFSRLYVGVHYPTDVLAGVAVGILAGFLGWLITKQLGKKVKALA